jgi:hypothetical protein
MTTTERCETTDLLVDQCGCPKHRGGQTIDEQAAAHRARLLGTGLWIPAQWPGTCRGCGNGFAAGAAIQLQIPAGWRAECCG